MEKRYYIFILLCLYIPVSMWSFDLSLAEIYQYSPDGSKITERDITKNLFNSLRKTDKDGVLSISRIKSKDIPKSILDTALLSETENIEFILYGFLKVSGNYYDFEVKLYDREAGEIKNIFYAKNSISGYDELLQTMSDRIITYFYKTLGVTKRKTDEKKEFGVIDIETGLGYWIPFDPWAKSLLGLVSVHTAVGFTPVRPLFRWDTFSFFLSYGIGLDYSLGMNRDGYEGYFLHSGRVGFPVTLFAGWHRVNRVVLSISPLLQVDILRQDRLYWNLVSKTSSAFSLSAALGYEYIFPGTRNSLGISLGFHTAFYNDILFSADPSLYYRYTFNSTRKGE